MSTQKGRDYEHQLINDIYDASDGSVVPVPPGYSGNHRIPAPDLIINDGMVAHAIELKRTKRDRQTFYCDTERQKDDIQQLVRFSQEYAPPTYPYVGVRFNRRQLILIKLLANEDGNWEKMLDQAVVMSPVEAKVTHKQNLSIPKPASGEWPTASSGDDAEYVLDEIGYYNDRLTPLLDRE